MAAVRVRIRFYGRVQGINFRHFVRTRADPLGVGGYVRNLPDGTVEAEFEGEARAVEELIRAAQEDHPLAKIERMERKSLPAGGLRFPMSVL